MTKIDDTNAIDRIAALLGSNTEWDSGYLETIADLVADTGRPYPGDQPPDVLAHYRQMADRFGYYYDEDED